MRLSVSCLFPTRSIWQRRILFLFLKGHGETARVYATRELVVGILSSDSGRIRKYILSPVATTLWRRTWYGEELCTRKPKTRGTYRTHVEKGFWILKRVVKTDICVSLSVYIRTTLRRNEKWQLAAKRRLYARRLACFVRG